MRITMVTAKRVSGLLVLFSSMSYAQTTPPNIASLESEAVERIALFANTLKSELGEAIQQGGLVAGIDVCQMKAPAIAESLSINGWKVARKSSKNRNPNNKPDGWEAEKIAELLDMLRNSESIENVTFSTTRDGQFRFAKAIKVAPMCLACHGEKISPEVKQALNNHYPNDLATGYKLGDLRGIFSVSKTLETP
jgi:hypothetical protein|tara:strand:+ start:1199 stop:1780 length:582 start_codon:yes stop_codon:yes gene_type:complete